MKINPNGDVISLNSFDLGLEFAGVSTTKPALGKCAKNPNWRALPWHYFEKEGRPGEC